MAKQQYTAPELRRLKADAYGSWYFGKKMGAGSKTQAEIVTHILDYRRYRAMLAQGEVVDETNARDNIVYRDVDADSRMGGRGGDRYTYDFDLCIPSKGWTQYDTTQDAWYFGMWVHVADRKIFTYCEGDRILVACSTDEGFKAELADAESFYGPPPPAFIVFDGAGNRTEVFDERPTA